MAGSEGVSEISIEATQHYTKKDKKKIKTDSPTTDKNFFSLKRTIRFSFNLRVFPCYSFRTRTMATNQLQLLFAAGVKALRQFSEPPCTTLGFWRKKDVFNVILGG